MTQKEPVARLALENGMIFEGIAFGDRSPKVVVGEVCFNTSMTGYQEILTDPSYAGQIVAMTYPQIGNTGVNATDRESTRVHARGFVVRELSPRPSNYRSDQSLEAWLEAQGVVGVAGIDTRALTRTLRETGALRGVICTDSTVADDSLVAQAQKVASLAGANLAQEVSITADAEWEENLGHWPPLQGRSDSTGRSRYRVVALDCGAKSNILRNLVDQGFDVTCMPWNATAAEILAIDPDGLFVSNGPGDPAAVEATANELKKLINHDPPLPIFGICLGHQLLALALGAETYKLSFGHRGANHPIQNLGTGKVEITSQNHGFAVDRRSLESIECEATHVNLNDDTLAGFRHRDKPIFAIQYHPEASPGPHDSRYLFDCFARMIQTRQAPTASEMDHSQRRRAAFQSS